MRKLLLTLPILAISWAGFAQADDAEGAKLFVDKTCVTCHGEKGDKPLMPTYPRINGQSADYALQQMKDFKSGARSNAQAAVMKGIMATVSDEEMEKLAKYLETLGAPAPAAQ